jgi:hypothetical protein
MSIDLTPLLLVISMGIAFLATISFLPAAKGHRLAPILAIPLLILGLYPAGAALNPIGFGLYRSYDTLEFRFFFLLPSALSGAALILWFRRSRTKK